MAYQSTYSGSRPHIRTTELIQIAEALRNSATPALNSYASYKGKEITKKTDRDADIAARSTEATSYAKAVENGELDGTQSPYWQSVYENNKGKAFGITYATQKNSSLNDWVLANKEEDPDWVDKDGSQYALWSADYDASYFKETLSGSSDFFLKGLDTYVTSSNMNLAAQYHSRQVEEQHRILKKNIATIIDDGLNMSLMSNLSTEEIYEVLDREGANAKLLAGISGAEFNALAIGAYESKIAELTIKGDPDSDYALALKLMKQAQDFKRTNGSTLFNAETKERWADLEQKLYAEMEQHEYELDKQRKEILTVEFIKDQEAIVERAFLGSALAGVDPIASQKAAFAKEAFQKIMLQYAYNNPDLDLEDDTDKNILMVYSKDVGDAIVAYYRSQYQDDLIPFDVEKWQNGNLAYGVNNIELIGSADNSFDSAKAELEAAVAEYRESQSGPIADLLKENNLDPSQAENLILSQFEKLHLLELAINTATAE
tara:strand:- start:5396 stop:6859 length:1464 start_codon:yes stop_codon:yes gene_type:complete